MNDKAIRQLREAITECKEIIAEYEKFQREYENILRKMESDDDTDNKQALKKFHFFFGDKTE